VECNTKSGAHIWQQMGTTGSAIPSKPSSAPPPAAGCSIEQLVALTGTPSEQSRLCYSSDSWAQCPGLVHLKAVVLLLLLLVAGGPQSQLFLLFSEQQRPVFNALLRISAVVLTHTEAPRSSSLQRQLLLDPLFKHHLLRGLQCPEQLPPHGDPLSLACSLCITPQLEAPAFLQQ